MTERTITDASGRVLVVRELDPSDMLMLAELGGEGATSRWMQIALLMYGVQSIDGKPVPPCTTKKHVMDLAKLVGNEGLGALSREFMGKGDTEQADEAAAAKN
jgi:hypothetical protein